MESSVGWNKISVADQQVRITSNNAKALTKRVVSYFPAEATDEVQEGEQLNEGGAPKTPAQNWTVAEASGGTPAQKRGSKTSQNTAKLEMTMAQKDAAMATKEAMMEDTRHSAQQAGLYYTWDNKSIKKKFRAPPRFEPLIMCIWALNAEYYTTVDLLDSGLKKAIYTNTGFR